MARNHVPPTACVATRRGQSTNRTHRCIIHSVRTPRLLYARYVQLQHRCRWPSYVIVRSHAARCPMQAKLQRALRRISRAISAALRRTRKQARPCMLYPGFCNDVIAALRRPNDSAPILLMMMIIIIIIISLIVSMVTGLSVIMAYVPAEALVSSRTRTYRDAAGRWRCRVICASIIMYKL